MDNKTEQDIESWSSLSIKRESDVEIGLDTLIINKEDDVQIIATKTKRFIASLIMEKVHPPFKKHGKVSSDQENSELSTFINNFNVMTSGNKTIISSRRLRDLQFLGFHRSIIRNSKNQIVSFIMTLDIGVIYITKDNRREDSRIGCTTFLVVHSSLRNVGLAMVSIKEAINIGIEFGVFIGYHTITEFKSANCILIPVWQLDAIKSFDMDGIYSKPIKSIEDIQNSRSIYLSFVQNKRFYFNPNEEEWIRWMKCFEGHLILDHKDEVIGIIILHMIGIIHKDTQSLIKIGWPMIIVGDTLKCIQICNNIYRNAKITYILFHEIGNITSEDLSQVGAKKTNSIKYLDFYNVGVNADRTDICLPLL